MRGVVARSTRRVRIAVALGALLAVAFGTGSAAALEFFDGRLQVHGFYEAQVRSIARDFDLGDDWDLTQWYNVLNVEIEADIAPDGVGPFDLVSFFTRLDIRYDCVWRRACGLASAADMFGDRSKRLPHRVTDRRRGGLNGHVVTGHDRRYSGIPRATQGIRWWADAGEGNGPRIASPIFNTPGIEGFFGIVGLDGVLETADDPANVAFGNLLGDQCRYGYQRLKGGNNGNGGRTLPWDPGCRIRSNGLNVNQPNPFRGNARFSGDSSTWGTAAGAAGFFSLSTNAPTVPPPTPLPAGGDFNSVSLRDFADPMVPGDVGFADFPLRPAPELAFTTGASKSEARGIWLPSAPNARLIREGKLDAFDQNFRQRELEWNRGASQQDEKELKEFYFDIEMFDSRLWIRAGKQQIVWGKTELFRTTDQFNPQDFALASLPSLEESRVGLWALRSVFSFYDVGPMQDVRLELAVNLDQFEPADLGRCGEPYTPLPVCDKTFGLQAHGLAGVALAGERRPPNFWNSWKGLEGGARLEWRWGRFSFALTDFYGFNDTPHVQTINRYSRNVDPISGRPRKGMSTGSCTGNVFGGLTHPDPGDLDYTDGRDFVDNGIPAGGPGYLGVAAEEDCQTPENALREHSANQTIFHLVCASSIGFTDLDLSVCGQSVFASIKSPLGGAPIDPDDAGGTIGALLSGVVAGNPQAGFFGDAIAAGISGQIVYLNRDPCDGLLADCVTPADALGEINDPTFVAFATPSLNGVLTQQQKALLGCGEFYGTNCETDGIDLMNTEASVFVQSWPGTEGSGFDTLYAGTDRDLIVAGDTGARASGAIGVAPQPGTVGWVPFAGPVGTREYMGERIQLPGARGPNKLEDPFDDDGFDVALKLGMPELQYNPAIDGCTAPLPGAAGLLTPGCNDGDIAVLPDGSLAAARVGDAERLEHPNGQLFRSEMAVASWNALNAFVALSFAGDDDGLCNGPLGAGEPGCVDGDDDPDTGIEFDIDEFDPDRPYRLDGCSFARPNTCSAVSAFWAITGLNRNTVNAGGNLKFGRRDFIWHGGKELVARYEKRNVLGLSMDVAEDVTKTNWSFEFTWIEGLQFTDNNELGGLTKADSYNLTVSVDRPTFINFLNQNRTFFFNSQWFFQYVDGYRKGFTANGPFNMLATLTFFTGYFQDRLLPTNTFVYDFRSNSGAYLPSITYRFTEAFSAQIGVAAFFGRMAPKTAALVPTSLPDRAGPGAYNDYVEGGLSLVRERDEAYLRIKYTF